MKKVAAVTLAFWVWKICATTLGETAGDLVSMTLGVGYPLATVLLLAAFALSLVFQLRSDRFHPALYWFVILTTSTAGTTMSDFIDRTLHMGYSSGALMLATILCLVLLAWRVTEGTLLVDDIRTRRAELFYWGAILISNTLGTALGDFLADDSGLGFLGGAALIASAITAIALCAVFTRIDRVLLFWAAFVLTRPFGATFGDLLTKPHTAGGLDFGTIGSSAVLAAILGFGVLHASLRHRRHVAAG